MKKNINIASLCIIALLFNACQTSEEIEGQKGAEGELSFSPSIVDDSRAQTYGSAEDFFDEGSEIDVSITSSNTNLAEQQFVYGYNNDGVFRGKPGYHFSLDDNHISKLTAVWPKNKIRKEGVITDQRELSDYRLADWMKATAPVWGIMPTDKPVPLHFLRENSLLEFELAGQSTNGIDIKSLLIELQVNNAPLAHWAYCGDGNNAKLILKAGTKITSPDRYLIGRLSVTEGEEYTIIFPQTNITLEAGKRYLVTLTSQGYNMYAYIFIGGWNETEDGVGIPFQQPTPNIDGSFVIDNPQQLIAMSYLMRHYTDQITFDWPSRTYHLSDKFEMSDEHALLYIPVPASLFTGKMLKDGVSITTVDYGTGKSLELFDKNN